MKLTKVKPIKNTKLGMKLRGTSFDKVIFDEIIWGELNKPFLPLSKGEYYDTRENMRKDKLSKEEKK